MENKEIEVVVEKEIEQVKQEQLIKYLDTFTGASALTKPEKDQFLEIATAFNLNPFKREIYAIAYGQGQYRKLSIITGYEVYLKRAERTGMLDGWRTWISEEQNDMTAHIEIYRKDRKYPFQHEVYFSEVAGKKKDGTLTAFWIKQPKFMLKKIAISQGFRLCFPDDIGGMPYTADELPEEMTTPAKNITPPKKEKQKKDEIPMPDLDDFPEDITEFFRENKYTTAKVKAFCFPFKYNWDEIRAEIKKTIELGEVM